MNGKVHIGNLGTCLICGLTGLKMTELHGDVWGALHGAMCESVFQGVFCCVKGLFRPRAIYFSLVEDVCMHGVACSVGCLMMFCRQGVIVVILNDDL
jgi:hypothetical protein